MTITMKDEKGNCKKCYGKGYSTQQRGLSGADDFGSEGFEKKPTIQVDLCDCDRGVQIDKLFVKKSDI
tara:strand:- start:1290 stop:1493 length:204 start_codon:yes stop_codon:yes gene_type:complete